MLDHQAVLVAQQNHIAGGPNNLVEMVEFWPRHAMSCADASLRNPKFADCQNSWGFCNPPGSTPCAFADLIQDFQTCLSVGGLVRPSTTAKTQSIWWVFALSIGVPHLEDESALVTAPTEMTSVLKTIERHCLSTA